MPASARASRCCRRPSCSSRRLRVQHQSPEIASRYIRRSSLAGGWQSCTRLLQQIRNRTATNANIVSRLGFNCIHSPHTSVHAHLIDISPPTPSLNDLRLPSDSRFVNNTTFRLSLEEKQTHKVNPLRIIRTTLLYVIFHHFALLFPALSLSNYVHNMIITVDYRPRSVCVTYTVSREVFAHNFDIGPMSTALHYF